MGSKKRSPVLKSEPQAEVIDLDAIRTSLVKKLHPNRFTAMSGKMAAIIGYILGEQLTTPQFKSLMVLSDGILIGMVEGDIGYNDVLGAYSNLLDNWKRLIVAADLTDTERNLANRLYKTRIGREV